jgi:hypothetical protein
MSRVSRYLVVSSFIAAKLRRSRTVYSVMQLCVSIKSGGFNEHGMRIKPREEIDMLNEMRFPGCLIRFPLSPQ